jgi:hypothetical protein
MTDLALASADEFEGHGLDVQIIGPPAEFKVAHHHMAVTGYPPGAVTTSNDPVGPDWTTVVLDDRVECDLWMDINLNGMRVYVQSCSFDDYDPETTVPDLIGKFNDCIQHPENIPGVESD